MKNKEQLLAEKKILVDALELQKKNHGDSSRWHTGWDFLQFDIKQYDKELKAFEDDKYKNALKHIRHIYNRDRIAMHLYKKDYTPMMMMYTHRSVERFLDEILGVEKEVLVDTMLQKNSYKIPKKKLMYEDRLTGCLLEIDRIIENRGTFESPERDLNRIESLVKKALGYD